MAVAIPVDEESLPWGPRVVSAGMGAQRVISGGGWDINVKEVELSKGSMDSSDFLKKFFDSAGRRYGKIMPPKEELCVPGLETYHLERPYAVQMPMLEHAAREFVDSSKLSKMGTRANRSAVEPTCPPPPCFNASKLQGLSPDMKGCMSMVDSRGNERFKEIIQE